MIPADVQAERCTQRPQKAMELLYRMARADARPPLGHPSKQGLLRNRMLRIVDTSQQIAMIFL